MSGSGTIFFATCLVELLRPYAGLAALEHVESTQGPIAIAQSPCCGQPAFNAGHRQAAQEIAIQVLEEMRGYDQVVVPSASCAAMIKVHYPSLLAQTPFEQDAKELASSVKEWSEVCKPSLVTRDSCVALHISCSARRELPLGETPKEKLGEAGYVAKEPGDCESCCGFGGTFAVKHPEISLEMADRKLDQLLALGEDKVTSTDLGCLIHLAGRAKFRNLALEFRHIAEVICDATDQPAI